MRQLLGGSLLLLFFTACPGGPDTCNEILGDTFFDVLPGLVRDDGGEVTVSVHLVALDTLPELYFSEAAIVRNEALPGGEMISNDAAFTTLALSQKDSLVLRIAPAAFADGQAEVVVRYPDRRSFIDCSHPGSGDRYFLLLRLKVEAATITGFSWEEFYAAGGF